MPRSFKELGEVGFELAAVVGQHRRGALGQQGQALFEGVGGVPDVPGGEPHGKGEV
jgi:hypothetical protein